MPTWHRLIRIISPIKLFWLGGQLFEHRPAGSHRHVSLQRPSGASIEGPSIEGPGTKGPGTKGPGTKGPSIEGHHRGRRGHLPRVTVIGTGYLGLTHAVAMADLGHDVLAIDVDEAKIAKAARGEVPFFEPGLEPLLRKNLEARRLRFTMSCAAAGSFGEVHFLCVGTPEGKRPGQPELRPGGGRRAGAAPEVRVPDRGQVHRPGRDGPASAAPGTCHRPGGSGGRAGLESGVPSGRTRGTGQPHSRPHRARRDVRLRGGADAAGVRRAARGGHAAARDRPGNGRAGQGGGERVPRDQDSRSSTPWPRSARRRAPT